MPIQELAIDSIELGLIHQMWWRFQILRAGCVLLGGIPLLLLAEQDQGEAAFAEEVLPVLVEYCFDCHDPEDSDGGILFLDAQKASDVHRHRAHWRSVGAQLLNRTMPPERKPQPTDLQRIAIARWIEDYLRRTACDGEPYAGYVTARRLNRLEYDNTIHDLTGIDFRFSESLPADSGSGEGFDNNGESLFLPPMLMERYLEGAQRVVDEAIVSPRVDRRFGPADFVSSSPSPDGDMKHGGRDISVLVPIYVEDTYSVQFQGTSISPRGRPTVLVDGIETQELESPGQGAFSARVDLQLARGVHALSLKVRDQGSVTLDAVDVQQKRSNESDLRARAHRTLLGLEVGKIPVDLRGWAERRLGRFVSRAFRRPLRTGELEPFLMLFDRSIKRGDPFEEAMKLAFKGVLVSPDFLFRIEAEPHSAEPMPVSQHELAVRLSYFLWATMPDPELRILADLGRLEDPAVLREQVDRMLDDARAYEFSESFIGQWLGTKDVGGRVAPTHNEIQKFYTPEVAKDMRSEAVWLWHHMLRENRSVLEFIDAKHTFLTKRLAKFYGYQNDYDFLEEDQMKKVVLRDSRRGGLLGLGAVLAMTSHFKEKSPVLRGAWVFDTLLGTPVPPPPADVPSLDSVKKLAGKKLTPREIIEQHRAAPSCRACHNLIDPIGFALNNFDYLGRWEEDENGEPIDARGQLPTGETFRGPSELKQVLLGKKEDFLRQLSRKLLGYALGRGLDDADECTIVRLVQTLEDQEFRARTLIHSIVQSTPFRCRQSLGVAGEGGSD